MNSDWRKKTKGNAKIYIHPKISHSIVSNHYGVFFKGERYNSVDDAKYAAEKGLENEPSEMVSDYLKGWM